MTFESWLGVEDQEDIRIKIPNAKYRNSGETFERFVDRISGGNEKLKQLIIEQKFLFGGRILSNRGVKGEKLTYSNCYVVAPPEDNIESIYDSRKHLARTYSYGGGCGIDLSKLSPAGVKVNNQAKQASGAVSFMEGYSITTKEIGQGGRRGALMLSLDCSHPDIEEFIDIKSDLDAVTKANISVRITDEFMEAVIGDRDWELSFTRQQTGETLTKTVSARKLFDKLCKNNWDMGEPGVLFWDTICNWNLLSNNPDFEYAGVNPCAEEPLPSGGSCLLGSINLSKFVKNNKTFDYLDFRNTVFQAVIALNEVLEEGLPLHPLEEQRKSVADWRQIGLGIMGLADMLIKMEIPYDSEEALEVCNKIAEAMIDEAIYSSAVLAKELGTYPKYTTDVMNTPFFKVNTSQKTKDAVAKYGLRNSQILTIAPTGSISTMLGISGGVEPIFANYYTRKTESLHNKDEYFKVYTPIVDKYMKEHNLTDESQLPEWFVTSKTIDPIKRVKMQSIWQSHIDASISSTVNLPYEATIEDVKKIYTKAWEYGLKGITIFRDGCKRAGILTTSPVEPVEEEVISEPSAPILKRGDIIECSYDLVGKKRKLTTGCGSLHVLAYFDPASGDMMEVYLNKGSTGGCSNFTTGLSRMISLLCRAGVDVYTIKDQLDSTGACPSYATRSATKHDTSKGACCPMAVGNALISMYEEMKSELDYGDEDVTTPDKPNEVKKVEKLVDNNRPTTVKAVPHASFMPKIETKPVKVVAPQGTCPECHEPLAMSGGCSLCVHCGNSKCD